MLTVFLLGGRREKGGGSCNILSTVEFYMLDIYLLVAVISVVMPTTGFKSSNLTMDIITKKHITCTYNCTLFYTQRCQSLIKVSSSYVKCRRDELKCVKKATRKCLFVVEKIEGFMKKLHGGSTTSKPLA